MRISARSALFTVGLSFLATLPGSARALEIGPKIVVAGKSYDMPRGDLTSDGEAGTRPRTIPRRTLIGDAALNRIKVGPGAPLKSDPVLGRPATPDDVRQPDPLALPDTVTIKCPTNSANGSRPPDIHGAATPNRLVVVTNTLVGVYNKATCSLISRKDLTVFFRPVGIPQLQDFTDPQVIYDEASGRCFLSAFTYDRNDGPNQFLYYAVSKTSDCTSWWLYRITLSDTGSNTVFCKNSPNDFWDYPKNGSVRANGGRWFITANLFFAQGGGEGRWLYIDKTPTLAGGPTTVGCVTGAPFNVIPPIVKDSNPAAYFLSPGGAGFGNAILRSFHIASTEGISFDSVGGPSSISVPDWTAPPNAPQPNGKTLDTLDGRFVSQTQQVGTALWNVHPINVGGFSRVRLYQFDQTATAPLFIFTPSSVAGTNNDHLFNPSVAVDGPSNLAFITASRTIPADPQNGKPGMLIFKGSANSDLGWLFHVVRISPHQYVTCTTDPCRWGDYSAMQIDPSNHTRAWGFNQIVTGPSDLQWSTRAAKVR